MMSNRIRISRGTHSISSLYEPLDATRKEIRVLNIWPLSIEDRLIGSLEVVSLLHNQPHELNYEALSWCWGTSEASRGIFINGQLLEITQAAHDTLRNLCLVHKHSIVWMDAVCINQKDLAERTQQVALMKDVYSKANAVLVWLGDENHFTPSAINSMDTLEAQCLQELSTSECRRQRFWNDAGILQFSDGPLPSCDWKALTEFYATPWFSRLWVVQEVMLGRNATCYRGQHQRPWSTVSLVAQWLEHRLYSRTIYCNGIKTGIDNAAAVWRNSNSPTPRDLTDLLYMIYDFGASVQHDKIYGCLGILSDNATATIRRSGLSIDYDQKVENVYAAATRAAIIQRHQSADQLEVMKVIGTVVPPDPNEVLSNDWPSWVPRYHWISGANMRVPVIRTPGKGASNGQSCILYDHPDNLVLSLSGLTMGRVSALGSIFSDELTDNAKEWSEAICECHTMAIENNVSERDFALTLTCAITAAYTNAAADEAFMNDYEDFLAACENGHASIEDDEAGYAYHNAIWQGSGGRMLFVTENGGIGMGPPDMAVGDHVCILLGGKALYVLRQVGKVWRLVGSAYSYGVMDGEYVSKLQEESRLESTLQRFDIR